MASQPIGDGHSRTVGRRADWASAFDLDDERTVGLSLAEDSIVDAHTSRPIHARQRQRQAAYDTQDRIGVGPHPQMAGQARTSLAAGRKPDPTLGLREAARPTRSRRHQPREWRGEGTAAAGGMKAVEASDAQAQRHGPTKAWQIGRTVFVAAMNDRVGRAAGRTPTANMPRMGDDDETAWSGRRARWCGPAGMRTGSSAS